LANGTRIEKAQREAYDMTPIGSQGRVLGSVSVPSRPEIGYFIEWDHKPWCAVFCIDWKLKQVLDS
jgi:hypothetical protein